MQEIAISLVAKKLEVALMVEGELPEGLADYASSGGSIVQELGKALIEGGDYTGAEKAWANFRKNEIEAQLGVSRERERILREEERRIIHPDCHPGQRHGKGIVHRGKEKIEVRGRDQRGRPRCRCRGQNDPVRPLLTNPRADVAHE